MPAPQIPPPAPIALIEALVDVPVDADGTATAVTEDAVTAAADATDTPSPTKSSDPIESSTVIDIVDDEASNSIGGSPSAESAVAAATNEVACS